MTVLSLSYKICSCTIYALIRCRVVSKTQCDLLELLFYGFLQESFNKTTICKQILTILQNKVVPEFAIFHKQLPKLASQKKSAPYLVAYLESKKTYLK